MGYKHLSLSLFIAIAPSVVFGAQGNETNTTLEWGPCDPTVITNPALSCAFLDVPLDYFDVSAGTARLALAKVNATGERRGTAFLNPGGPGGSGLQALNEDSQLLLALTAGLYDVVSWDPRGIGSLTTPGEIYCFDSVDEYNAFFNGTIELSGIDYTGSFTDAHDIQRLLAQAPVMQCKYEELGQRCLDYPSGRFLKYVGTAAAVRDMVRMADVLDGPGAPVNYLGASYGTYLGAWFVNMFPERVGKVILDGVINPVLYATEELPLAWHNQVTSTDSVYKAFVVGCVLAGPQGCALASAGQTPEELHETILAVLQAAYDADTKTDNGTVSITSGHLRADLFGALYFPSTWATFANEAAQIAQNVSAGSGQRLERRTAALRHNLLKRAENSTVSYTPPAIFCSDNVDPRGTNMSTVFDAVIARAQNTSHMFGALWPEAFDYCPFWPVRAVERYQGPFNKTLANKIALVGNTYDPVTPFTGAQALAGMLGDSASLIRLNAFGHTSTAEPSSCILALAQAYFANGTLPDGDGVTVCEVDDDFEPFQGVNTAAIMANLSSFEV